MKMFESECCKQQEELEQQQPPGGAKVGRQEENRPRCSDAYQLIRNISYFCFTPANCLQFLWTALNSTKVEWSGVEWSGLAFFFIA